jgi:hypothetical protein
VVPHTQSLSVAVIFSQRPIFIICLFMLYVFSGAYGAAINAGLRREAVYLITWFQQAVGFCLQLSVGLAFPGSEVTTMTVAYPIVTLAAAVIAKCASCSCSRPLRHNKLPQG